MPVPAQHIILIVYDTIQ